MGVECDMWKSEENFVELVLFFYSYVGPKDQNQVTRLVQKVPLPAEPTLLPHEHMLFL